MRFVRLVAIAALSLCAVGAQAAYSPVGGQDGSSVVISKSAASSGTFGWPGGIGVLSAVGTWNGATLTMQFLGPDGATFIAAGAATTLTSNGAGVFYLPKCSVKVAITNPGGSTSITAAIGLVQASPR